MIKHTSPLSGIATDNKQYIASAGYDNKVILWEAKTKEAIAVSYHDHLANQCEFSPCGTYLLSTSSDHTARLWQVPSLKLMTVFSEHLDDVECASFHPTDTFIATGSRDSFIRIFNYSGSLVQKLVGHTADVISLQWLTDGTLVSSSDDGTIKQWDINSGQVIKDINNNGVQTDAIAVTESGTVYAGDDEGHIITANDNNLYQQKAHAAGIKKLSYNPRQKLLVSLSYDRKGHIWATDDINSLKHIASFDLPNIIWARSCAFHGDNELVFSTFGDRYAIYNYKDNAWSIDTIKNTGGINAILVDKEATYTIGDAGILYCNSQYISQLPSLCNFLIKCGATILTGGQTGEVFDAIRKKVIYHHHSPLNCAASFTRGKDRYVLIGTYTGEGILLKCQDDGSMVYQECITLHDNAIKGIACSNTLIFSVCATSACAFHRIEDFHLFNNLPAAHDKIANGCVHIENNLFASISRDLTLRLTTPENQTVIHTPHKHSIKCLAISNDTRFIATGGYHGMVAIYDRSLQSWQISRPTIHGISCITFDTASNQFKASSYNGRVYAIDIDKG